MRADEPISQATWPTWRKRHLEWRHDRSQGARDLRDWLEDFVGREAQANNNKLPGYLIADAVAWDLYGDALLHAEKPAARADNLRQAEAAYRHSIELDAAFASPHAGLAAAFMSQEMEQRKAEKPLQDQQDTLLLGQAEQEIAEYTRLDPEARPESLRGFLALVRNDVQNARSYFRQALQESPDDARIAVILVQTLFMGQGLDPNAVTEAGTICQRFPENGQLQTFYALVCAVKERPAEAMAALAKARALGVDPRTVLQPEIIDKIEETCKPSLLVRALWVMAWVAGAFAAVILLMAAVGVMLAAVTRGGPPAPESFDVHDVHQAHPLLTKLYIVSLMVSLMLFYVSIPFVLLGLVGGTLALLYGIFQLPQIPIKLILLVVIVGFGMVVAVIKSLFARMGQGSFGVQKTDADCARLFQVVRDVGKQVDTRAVDQVYIAPGSTICVHQEGRGPFGIFGVKRRVLTLGLATLRYLSVTELRAILAHEYAHFSHKDTAYSRFIHQVTVSIGEALRGMGAAGGKLNYVNPFYWFFVLYYRAYSLLSAGFSRSREFLADRMAACLYGKDAFISGLTTVATSGSLFETTAYKNIDSLLGQGKAYDNIYEVFSSYRDEQLSDDERYKLFQETLNEKGSVFASHPTIRERLAAITMFPASVKPDETPAISLFDDPEALEKELTVYMTGYVNTLRMLRAQAAQAASRR
jgi:Zn-dependent protease with chaperone function